MLEAVNKNIDKDVRDQRIDSLKFLLICLVIIGHLLAPSRYTNVVSGAIYSIIYAFHMPIFVFISGYLTKSYDWTRCIKRVILLLETYLVIMITQAIVFQEFHHIIIPENSGWYLISLATWTLLSYFIQHTNYTSLIISILVGGLAFLFGMPINEQVFSLMRTILYFPIFIVGFTFRNNPISKPIRNNFILYTSWGTFLLLVTLITAFSGRDLHILEFNRDSFPELLSATNWSVEKTIFAKCLWSLSVAFFIFFFLKIVSYPKFFSKYGQNCLTFFTIQGCITHIYRDFFNPSLLHALLASVTIILICCYISRFNIQKLITNPFTFVFNGFNQYKASVASGEVAEHK